jgi:FtsP/CotA-like multicopper oxidase with cupredoxin domain
MARRSFLGGAAVAAGGALAATLAACASPGSAARFAAAEPSPSSLPDPTAHPHSTSSVAPAASQIATASPISHDTEAKAVVDRFLAGEWEQVPGYGNQPLEPSLDGDTKVFELTIDHISHSLTATIDPVEALGFKGMWPGPQLRVVEGDRVRATFTNNLVESTGIHFHGQDLPNAMDGVPFLTQPPILPGEQFTYEFEARPSGSHMYHSHHNATDQVGRGLLGAFLVDPQDASQRYDRRYGATQDIVWISNDAFGGFTINGRQFPATAPIVANRDETIVIRFMNEGVMMHPWHLHGMPMRVVARDGYPLGGAEFTCDTLGVNPGERWDAVIDCRNPGAWAFHCHILPHAEGIHGMFGMVTALIVQE